MIVESSKRDLQMFQSYLKDTDYEAFYFESAEEALDQIAEIGPNLIILNYMMTEMTGNDFMIILSERLLHVNDWQVFIMSANQLSEEDKTSMLTLGITHVFKKPISKNELLSSIDQTASDLADL